jgi:tripartite-type tricarboxylate transporter receptor subunit TctC
LSLRNEISAYAKSPAVAERLTSLGIVPGGLTKDETDAMFKHDYAAFAAAIKAAGLASQ